MNGAIVTRATGPRYRLMPDKSRPLVMAAFRLADCLTVTPHNVAMELSSTDAVVMEGTFLYDGTVVCDLRIVRRPIRFGTGDCEDPPEIRNDLVQDTFYLEYGSATQRGAFNAGGGAHASLLAAIAEAEAAPGFGNSVVWK